MTRAGFTLVEVMVAIAAMSVMLAGAGAMLGQIADDADRIAAAGRENDRDANAELFLRSIVQRMDPAGRDSTPAFTGYPHGARFGTWCEVPDGWLEPCRATLGFVHVNAMPTLALSVSGERPIVVRRGFRAGKLIYLRDGGDGGEWVSRWGASILPPLAIGLVTDGDTAVLRIGERG